MCKRVLHSLVVTLCRCLLKRIMRTSPKVDEDVHPAVSCIRSLMSGDNDCLVLWGPHESNTFLCAQAIAHSVIREKGLAKVFRCDQIDRERVSLQKFFLDAVRCITLENFVLLLPVNKRSHCVWLIFDAVDRLQPDTIGFFRSLIQLSRESSKFKVIICTHEVRVACAILGWANFMSLMRIKIVEPIGCCRWSESHLSKLGANGPMQVRAGCPGVKSEADVRSLETEWEYGVARLGHLIRHKKSGAPDTICFKDGT